MARFLMITTVNRYKQMVIYENVKISDENNTRTKDNNNLCLKLINLEQELLKTKDYTINVITTRRCSQRNRVVKFVL